jgi:hypothetical protein
MPEKEYELSLAASDKLKIRFESSRGEVVYFVVQYYAKIKGKWRTIMRVDNHHGYPHKHTYYLQKKESRVKLKQDNSIVFNQYIEHIKLSFKSIKENYLNS